MCCSYWKHNVTTLPTNRWLPLSILLLLGIVWGTGYSIARYAMTHDVPPLGYGFWQAVGPAVLIGLLARQCRTPLLMTQHWRYYFIIGLTGIVLPNTNMYFAAMHLPAGLLAVIVNTVPIMAYVLSLCLGLESFTWLRLLAIILGCTGLMLILVPHASLPTPELIPWVLLALLTPFCFAFTAVYMTRFRPHGTHSLALAAGTLLIASLILTPIVLSSGMFYVPHIPFATTDWVILLEILLSSLGYLLFFQLIKIAGPVYYSFVDTIVALTGLFWGYTLFHEHLNFWTGSAVLFILCSLILVTRKIK